MGMVNLLVEGCDWEYDFKDIAMLMNMSESGVKSLYEAAMQKLLCIVMKDEKLSKQFEEYLNML
jgi:DNA-directed RNA polymerase specialized sigma24 family protein